MQFLKKQGDKLTRENAARLQDYVSELRMRYERLNNEGDSRVQQLASALDYLRNFDKDVVTFEHWLNKTKDTVEGFGRDAGRDINVLKKQSSQLQSLNAEIRSNKDQLNKTNLTGQGFLNNAKVRYS